jgi:putative hydrolase of the HAD superfamily
MFAETGYNTQMITTLLFDADGVLINGKKFSAELEREYGISAKHTAPFFTGKFNDCLIGKADLKKEISKHLAEWGWKRSAEDLLEYWFTVEHSLDHDLIEYIQELRRKGITCYIATNQEMYRAAYMLEKMGFRDAFDGVWASAHLGHKKPAEDFFKELLSNIGTTVKEQVLFWDDTKENVEAARNFGIDAEVYTSFSDFKQKMLQYLR